MSTRPSSAARLLPVFLLMAISTGCTSYSAGRDSSAPTNHSVALSRDCERLAGNVNDPVVDAGTTDPWRAVGEYAVALGEANANLDATRACQQTQRKRLAKGK